MPKPTITLPVGIEVFKAGKITDDAGNVHHFSEADVAGMASCYDPALREAPLCIGHPEHNRPAYGWMKTFGLSATGSLLLNETRNVIPQFAEAVMKRQFPKRSMSFYPPTHPNNPKPGYWYPRHLAFLGAQQPALAGLADLPELPSFSEGDSDDGVVNFSEALTTPEPIQENDMDKELQLKLDAANEATRIANEALAAANKKTKEAEDKVASFAEQTRKDRTASHVSFCEGEVKAGRLLPKDQAAAVAVLDLLADAQPVSFSEAGATKTQPPVEFLKGLISGGAKVVNFGEQAAGSLPQNSQATNGASDVEIDKLAKAHMKSHPAVNYSEALRAVTANFTTAA